MCPRTSAVVCCIALVILAGCSFGPGGPGADSAAYTQSGEELNATKLQADHTAALANNSFTLHEALLIDAENQSGSLNRTVSFDGDRSFSRSVILANESQGMLETQRYGTADVTYQRFSLETESHSSTTYQRSTAPYSASTFPQPINRTEAEKGEFAAVLVDTVNWTQTGVVERDGVKLTRYEASGEENLSDFRDRADISPTERANLSAFDATVSDIRVELFLTSEGVIREFRLDISATVQGRETDVTYLMETTEIGSTSVDEPDWLEEAKNKTQQDG